MSSDGFLTRLDSIAIVNPQRRVKKGSPVPFIDMAALPQFGRDIQTSDVLLRNAKGAGAHFTNGDTLLARITPCLENGKTAQVGCLDHNAVGEGSTEFIVLSGIKPEDNDFVYYLCRDPSFRSYAIGRMEGTSGRQRVSWQSIAAYEFYCPSPETRHTAAGFLALIEDRITLLRETNKTLESIAKAIFKSWFVDFDPVHAKVKGLAPEGMDEATAALFPDSFEETELGMVPKGWTLGLMSDFMRLHKGTINPGQHPDKLYQHFSLPAFDNGKRPVLELGAEIKSNKTSVPANAVMISKLNPRTPRIWLPSSLEKDAICSTEFLPFVPFGNGTTSFIYCKLLDPFFSDTVAQFVTGTSNSHQRIRPDTVLNLSTIVPTSEPIMSFDSITSGLFSRVKINEQQVQNLSDLRDTLLPRLISGQLRIEEAQDMVESV
jgi:type I restriction enzyme S subunit